MPKQLPTPTPESRYSYRRAADEVAAEIDERTDLEGPGFQKQVAGAIGLDESAFSHRLTGVKSKFTIEQLGAIADFLQAPPGWPFVPRKRAGRSRSTTDAKKRGGKT
jgi:hypothetical protein